MASSWHLLKEVNVLDDGHIEATAEVPADSPWFSGHFPGEPILPGIALIHIVNQAIAQDAAGRGMILELGALKRVKFMQPVRPGDVLSVHISTEKTQTDDWFSFKIVHEDHVICSGSLAARKK